MEKTILTFRADNQILTGQNVPERFASDTVSYIEAVFDLGENWSGFDAVKAVWSTDFDSLCTVLDSSGTCVVPWEVLERVGDVWVNLVGSISENDNLTDRLTTYPIKAVVVDANAAVCGSETSPVTPSQFDQFVEVVRADADRAEEGATAAAASASAAATSAAWSDERATDSSNAAYTATNARAEAERWAGEANRAQYYAWQEADNANSAARDAEEAKNTILNMTATAQTLPEGSEATVDYNNGVMAFGIPRGDTGARGAKGDTGETGATPQMSIGTVETLEPSEDASVSIRGTAEEPILDFGIPKGETGDVSLLELIANTKVDEKTDSVPYQMRTLSGVGSHESLRKIVGGTVAWNQQQKNTVSRTSNGITYTYLNGKLTISGTAAARSWWLGGGDGTAYDWYKDHIYFVDLGNDSYVQAANAPFWYIPSGPLNIDYSLPKGKSFFKATRSAQSWLQFMVPNGYAISEPLIFYPQVFDLTQMFGSTIADYIYSLEQATAGAGVAFFKALFPEDYYPYDLGTLKSVQSTAHKTYDADGNVIGNYPLDSSLTLRGIPKLDASNNLYYDGDTYKSDGTVTRKRKQLLIDGNTERITGAWGATSNGYAVYKKVYDIKQGERIRETELISDKFIVSGNGYQSMPLYTFGGASGEFTTVTFILPSTVASVAEANAWFASNPTTIEYLVATPTTETASPYTELQEVESGGSEEFVGAEIPVGHESVYPRTLADTMPTQDGSYTLSLTVSGGKPFVEWEVSQ